MVVVVVVEGMQGDRHLRAQVRVERIGLRCFLCHTTSGGIISPFELGLKHREHFQRADVSSQPGPMYMYGTI